MDSRKNHFINSRNNISSEAFSSNRSRRPLSIQKRSIAVTDKPFPDVSLLSHVPYLIQLARTSSGGIKKHDVRTASRKIDESDFSKNSSALTSSEISDFSKALLLLQRGLTGERNLAGSGYMDKKDLLGAYLLYYWPISYIQAGNTILSAKAELLSLLENTVKQNTAGQKRTIKILDIGSGPGPATAALYDFCLDFCKQNKTSIQFEFTFTDSSKEALDCAKKVILEAARRFTADLSEQSCKTVESKNPVQSPKIALLTADFQKGFLLEQEDFDIIIASHSLNELWGTSSSPVQKRREFIESISKNISSDGLLFLIEPALLLTSRNLIALRDGLIQDGYSVVSPCPSSSVCPALKAEGQQTCHAEFFWNVCEPAASLASAAGLDRESVKMTFFVFHGPQPELLQKNQHIQDTKTGSDSNGETTVTVVSDGMLNKSGRIRYLVCNGQSRIAFSAKKDESHAAEQGFFSLRRYDKIQIVNPEKRGDEGALGMRENTKIVRRF